MTTNYESILSSRPFRFLVGQDKREYMLHAAVVAHQSKSLDKLVNGEMKEAREDCAIWEEMDEHTFIRFSEYAYTGDYSSANPHQLVNSSVEEPKTIGLLGNTNSPIYWELSLAEIPSQSKRDQLWGAFKARPYIVSGSGPESRQNRENEDYSEVFLSHARLFVFADYHGIPTLEMLVLHKLRNVLATFNLYESRIGDVTHLIRYSYENTVQLNESLRGLRELVTSYAACKIEELWKSRDFQDLLETCGDFAKDIVGEMLKRLD